MIVCGTCHQIESYQVSKISRFGQVWPRFFRPRASTRRRWNRRRCRRRRRRWASGRRRECRCADATRRRSVSLGSVASAERRRPIGRSRRLAASGARSGSGRGRFLRHLCPKYNYKIVMTDLFNSSNIQQYCEMFFVITFVRNCGIKGPLLLLKFPVNSSLIKNNE